MKRVPSAKEQEWFDTAVLNRLDQLSPDIQRVRNQGMPQGKRVERVEERIREAATVRALLLEPALRDLRAGRADDIIQKWRRNAMDQGAVTRCADECHQGVSELEKAFWETLSSIERQEFEKRRPHYMELV
jgi:hypothetical protein